MSGFWGTSGANVSCSISVPWIPGALLDVRDEGDPVAHVRRAAHLERRPGRGGLLHDHRARVVTAYGAVQRQVCQAYGALAYPDIVKRHRGVDADGGEGLPDEGHEVVRRDLLTRRNGRDGDGTGRER
jgi:hypothetical protein